MKRSELDDRDRAILADRAGLFNARCGPRVGDYVDFADGITRRISHIWDIAPCTVQTSDGGSWYLGKGFCSFSGGLHPGIARETLTLTGEVREGSLWFFHHDYHTADNGVETTIPFRVYSTTIVAHRASYI